VPAATHREAWNDLVLEYKALLVSEAHPHALVHALLQVDRFLSVHEWRLLESDGDAPIAASVANATSFDTTRTNRLRLRSPLFDFVRATPPNSALPANVVLESIEFAMQLPGHIERGDLGPLTEAEHSFLIDLALVVFHHAYFAFADELLGVERRRLLVRFREFTRYLPRVADRLRIKGLLFEWDDDADTAGWYLREAVLHTSPTAHEFITVLQSAWSFLVERGRYVQAFILLGENVTRVAARDRAEFDSLLLTTAGLARSDSPMPTEDP
jgi:hypothetical protein